MNILLIFFAITFVVIVISIALQKILKCPILVAAIIFSIILLVAIILGNSILTIASIFFGILSYIVAILQCIFSKLLRNNNICNNINSVQTTSLEGDSTNVINTTNMPRNNSCGSFYGCYRRR